MSDTDTETDTTPENETATEATESTEAETQATPEAKAEAHAETGASEAADEKAPEADETVAAKAEDTTADAAEASPAKDAKAEKPAGVQVRKPKPGAAGDVNPGDAVDGVYVVLRKTLPMDRNGNKFLAITLGDRTGRLEARLWDDAELVGAGFREADHVKAVGEAVTWQGRVQVRLSSVEKVSLKDVGLSPDEFVAPPRSQTEACARRIGDLVDSMENAHLKALLKSFLDDPDHLARFKKAPAAQTVHHAWIGGLIEHTLSVMQVGDRLCEQYPQVNRDLVLAGCFFHDYGKTAELTAEGSIDYTTSGRLVGHITLCAQWIHERAGEIDGFPEVLQDQLVHIVLSHHGRLEYGSPKLPMTLEALLVHHADVIDARVSAWTDHMDASDGTGWTDYQRHYDRRLFKTTLEGRAAPKKKKRRRRKKAGGGKEAAPRGGGKPRSDKPRSDNPRGERPEGRKGRGRGKGPAKGPPKTKEAPKSEPLTFNPFAAISSDDGGSKGE